jgi:hypothetical protein
MEERKDEVCGKGTLNKSREKEIKDENLCGWLTKTLRLRGACFYCCFSYFLKHYVLLVT